MADAWQRLRAVVVKRWQVIMSARLSTANDDGMMFYDATGQRRAADLRCWSQALATMAARTNLNSGAVAEATAAIVLRHAAERHLRPLLRSGQVSNLSAEDTGNSLDLDLMDVTTGKMSIVIPGEPMRIQ